MFMGVKERREREKLEIRDKILDAARELFITEGYEGVSMRKVAEMIEYSPTAIYLHFADKEELFRELCHEDFGRLASQFNALAAIEDPVERLRAVGRAYFEFGMQYPNHYKMMFMTEPPCEVAPDDRDKATMGNPEVDAYAFLKQIVQEAIDRGAFREGLDDAELISQTFWAGIHGVVALHIAKKSDYWVDWRPVQHRAELMLDTTIRGMLKEGK
jgi:AcrR family transcriptional regulator